MAKVPGGAAKLSEIAKVRRSCSFWIGRSDSTICIQVPLLMKESPVRVREIWLERPDSGTDAAIGSRCNCRFQDNPVAVAGVGYLVKRIKTWRHDYEKTVNRQLRL